MDKKFWLVLGAIAAIFVGIWYFGGDKKADTDTGNMQPTSHIKGKLDSKVTLVEYGDFQCPVCGDYYPLVTQLVEKYKDKISFQFRHLPLTQVHPNALAAARASEAAAVQGKFWEMYDQLFLNQATWSQSNSATKYFEQYATQTGLDLERYKVDAAAPKTNKLVNADMAAFKKTGDTVSTPTFYLNGKKLDLKTLLDAAGRPSIEKFTQVIDAKLKETGQQ